MSFLQPYEWLQSLPEGFSDGGSFRVMRSIALQNIAKLDGIRAEIVQKNGEQFAIDEWDTVFAEETQRYREAAQLIDTRLSELGFRP